MNDKLYEFTVYLNNGNTVSVMGTDHRTYLNEGEMIIYKGPVAQAVFRLSNIAGYTITPMNYIVNCLGCAISNEGKCSYRQECLECINGELEGPDESADAIERDWIINAIRNLYKEKGYIFLTPTEEDIINRIKIAPSVRPINYAN